MSYDHHDPQAQRQEYFKVFRYLVVLTISEVVFVMLPLPKLLITLLVVTASCTKAGLVGYYYMHLKQETLWLKLLACLPLIMFGYLAVLGPDSYHRPAQMYLPERPRIWPKHHEEDPSEKVVENAAEEAQKELLENGNQRLKAEKSQASGTETAPTTPPASSASPHSEGTSSGTTSADDFR